MSAGNNGAGRESGESPEGFPAGLTVTSSSAARALSKSPAPLTKATSEAGSTSHSSIRVPRFAFVAGEASGDQLGADLIAELKRRHPDAQIVGVGGELMRAAGLDAWHDCSELAVMGYTEVIRHLPRLLRLRRSVRRQIIDWKPDVFIGIDAPDFNLGLERALKRTGIRTVHYVSPSVWAWKEKRAASIGNSADEVLCLFPMEPAIYARHGVQARYVGHPLADMFPLEPDRTAARTALALHSAGTVVALLPGSRLSEIERLGADFLRAAALLLRERPKLRFLAPMANAACRAAFLRQLDRVCTAQPQSELRRAMSLLDGRAHEAMIAADVVVLASGTAALEAMLAKRPMVVAYRIAASTYRLVKGLGMLKVDQYSLPNILHAAVPMANMHDPQQQRLAGKPLVPELMQQHCTPQALAEAVADWLDHTDHVAALQVRFRELHLALQRNASVLAANAIDALLPMP